MNIYSAQKIIETLLYSCHRVGGVCSEPLGCATILQLSTNGVLALHVCFVFLSTWKIIKFIF